MIRTIDPLASSSLKSLPLQIGDTIAMLAGNYAGLDLTGLSGIKFIPVGGVVNFIGNIKLGGTNGITFDGTGVLPYGFKYSGKDFQVFDSGKGNIQAATVLGFDFGNTASVVFDSQTKIWVSEGNLLTYDGSKKSCVFSDLYVKNCKASGKTGLFFGTFEPVTSYHMVNTNLYFGKIIFENDGTGQNIKISGNSIYNLTAEEWRVTGPTINQFDCGIIYIVGNANIKNCYRNGGWGYWARIINVFLTPGGSSSIQNCIDVNSTHYGTVDIREDPTLLNQKAAIPLYGGDFYFLHNTVGDKTDDGSYVTDAVVAGEMKDETGKQSRIVIKDNIAWNAMLSKQANNSSLLKNNGSTVIEMSNNIDLAPGIPLPDGYFIDKIDFVPAPLSPLIGKASDGSDIGAVKAPIATLPIVDKLKQRTVVSIEETISMTFTYDDGSKSTLTL